MMPLPQLAEVSLPSPQHIFFLIFLSALQLLNKDLRSTAGTTAGTALQNGKIKNKVLKLQTDVLRIQIEVAQGNTASQSELAAQQAKLATNVALDQAAAGQTSTAISFTGSD
jgi:hypothetical protein